MFCTSRKSRLGAKVGELHRPVDDYCRRRFGMILAAKEKYLHELQAKVVLIVSCVFVCRCSACTPCTNPRSTQSVSRSHHIVACVHVSNTHIRAYMLMHHLGRSKKRANAARGKGKGDSSSVDTPSSEPPETQPGGVSGVDPVSGLTHSEIDRATDAINAATMGVADMSCFFAMTPADQRPPAAPAFGRAASSSNLANAHVRTLRYGVCNLPV